MKTSHRRLIEEYKNKKDDIQKRLHEFKEAGKGTAKDIFTELCFCILTPQSNARQCDKAIKELKKKRLLFKAPAGVIRPVLKGRSRFHNKKAGYLVSARRNLLAKRALNKRSLTPSRKQLQKSIRS